jgi:hypothetical protein
MHVYQSPSSKLSSQVISCRFLCQQLYFDKRMNDLQPIPSVPSIALSEGSGGSGSFDSENGKEKLISHVKRAGGCPFHGKDGYCTADGRLDWIKFHGLSKHAESIPTSCEANADPSTPLYYWQLHSILGPENIQKVSESLRFDVCA